MLRSTVYKYSEAPIAAAIGETSVVPTRFLETVTPKEYDRSVPIEYTLAKAAEESHPY
jgi:hypothetical protein